MVDTNQNKADQADSPPRSDRQLVEHGLGATLANLDAAYRKASVIKIDDSLFHDVNEEVCPQKRIWPGRSRIIPRASVCRHKKGPIREGPGLFVPFKEWTQGGASDGARTRDLRRDRPAL